MNALTTTIQAEALARAWLALRQYEQMFFAATRQDYPFGKDAEHAAENALAEYLGTGMKPITANDVWPLVAN